MNATSQTRRLTSLVTSGFRISFLCALFACHAGCGAAATPSPIPVQSQPKGHDAEHHEPHWSYAGATGPNQWGDLKPEYAPCKTGTTQTPIDIVPVVTKTEKTLAPIVFNYQPIPLRIIHNGHTIEVTSSAPGFIQVGDKRYDLLQFHFHSRSEHTIAGKSFDMELHLVHKDAEGHLAVVGILLREGKENTALKPVWDHMPMARTEKEAVPSGIHVDLRPLLPDKAGYYTYQGSLTTPPCTEGVKWFVFVSPAELSWDQITKFQTATGPTTSRPVQPLNDRAILQFNP